MARDTAEQDREAGASPPMDEQRTAAAPAGDAEPRVHDEFGGVNWGSAFFGWLVAVGLSVILIALLSAAGTAVGLSASPSDARASADTVSLVGAILLLAVLMAAYYCGGYVAGRMSRFDGGRQGLAVWIFGLIVTVILAVVGAIAGSQFNVLQQLNLPAIPVDSGTLATGGVITLVAVVLGTLLAAFAGGKAGQRYHSRVDRALP